MRKLLLLCFIMACGLLSIQAQEASIGETETIKENLLIPRVWDCALFTFRYQKADGTFLTEAQTNACLLEYPGNNKVLKARDGWNIAGYVCDAVVIGTLGTAFVMAETGQKNDTFAAFVAPISITFSLGSVISFLGSAHQMDIAVTNYNLNIIGVPIPPIK